MSSFSEQMKALTDEVLLSKRERSAAVAGLQEHTARVLSDSRSFLKQLGEDLHQAGTQLRRELAADRQQRSEQLRSQRAEQRKHLQQSREQLRQLLHGSRSQRQQHMHELLGDFHTQQQQLASDFRLAARTWRHKHHPRPARS